MIKQQNSDMNISVNNESGFKLDKGKIKAGVLGDFSLALMAIAEVGTYGADKYSRYGWQYVENGIERYNDAAWRHRLVRGIDEESGLLHEVHEAWNVLAVLELTLRQKSIQDMENEKGKDMGDQSLKTL